MYGVVDFYKEAVNNGIKPILGCEIYTAKGSRFDKQEAGIRIPVIWCFWQKIIRDTKSDENCIHSFTEGFYYKPGLTWNSRKIQ